LFSAKSCRVGAGTALTAAGVDVTINKKLHGHSLNTHGVLDLPVNLTVIDTRCTTVFKNKNGK